MNNKLTVKNSQGEYLQHAIFTSQVDQDNFIAMLAETAAWGKPEHQVLVTPEQRIEHAELLDENNEVVKEAYVEVIEAVYETIPSEYTIEVEDISQQVNQESINREAQAFLDSTDFKVLRHYGQVSLGIPLSLTEEEYLILENERQEARERIVK